ncbi:hypothetical protein GCM10010324_56450 [Streptomyces hiroshimensis]|uniref:Uncharacterized protein n=1 Tax=Streptomyces hiroshimensis TaxID=66424 RepID=A0ABQ2Z1W5_9ACTN|nr:hypothetical protein GCM10010324_56450 [Streptomyces hiroshimensis]
MQSEMSRALRDGFQELRRQNGELRQELGGGLGGRLGELHEELRELRGALSLVREDVAATRRENEALRQELRAACREAAEGRTGPRKAGRTTRNALLAPPAHAAAEAGPAAEPEADEATPGQRLERAAGVGAAELVCHRDSWAFIVEQAARNAHFRVPGEVSAGDDGRTRVIVSGRSLMAILTALDAVRHQGPGGDPGDCALATKFYERIAEVVDTVRPDGGEGEGQAARGRERQRTVIVIDDRPGPP